MCILATDDEDVKDVALQIHFTLIQAFCCENDINILRVNNTRRLAEILSGDGGGGDGQQSSGEPMDLHCLLVTVSVCILTFLIAERVLPRDFPARALSSTGVELFSRKDLSVLVLVHAVNMCVTTPLHKPIGISVVGYALHVH